MVAFLRSSPVMPPSPETDFTTTASISELSTPLTQSGRASPDVVKFEIRDEPLTTTQKKKKKKKSKKSVKSQAGTPKATAKDDGNAKGHTRQPVLCISRNKHWRYISSYHGPWLQLPVELLDSLLSLNLEPTSLTGPETRLPSLMPSSNAQYTRQRDRRSHSLNDFSLPDSPRNALGSSPLPPPFPGPNPGRAMPPPIDPGVFRSVRNIRRLIDEAAELSVRASSGLSAAELGSMRSGSSPNGNPWAATQSARMNPLGLHSGGGRNVTMSPIRVHRLRALAVQKLAEAYRADEIASSVMVMQGGSVFDDLAERVLKIDPNDADAKYVHFFHEKIPSRQLAESTTTAVLDELIAAYPQRLQYYRTRGIVHCFREEFFQAASDFTYALKEARAIRKAKQVHHKTRPHDEPRTNKQGKRHKGGSSNRTNGQAPPNGSSALECGNDNSDGEPLSKHPSEEAFDPIEPQLLFLRGAAYLQQAVHIIEAAVLELEGVYKPPSFDGAESRLSYIENGKYGGVETGNPDGPLGSSTGQKLLAYASVLGEKVYRDYVTQLLKKSLRDHERFLSHFDSLDSPNAIPEGDPAFQMEYAFLLSECMRPGNSVSTPPPTQDAPAVFTTYHPLLVESHFSILICQLMLADFPAIVPTFIRTALVVDGLEGYPVFLPPRSMAQAEFIEVLERLASGWRNGIQPHSLSAQRGKCRLAIESPMTYSSPDPIVERFDYVDNHGAGSSTQSSIRNNNSSNGISHANGFLGRSDSSISNDDASSQSNDKRTKTKEETPNTRLGASEALDSARILLAPVVKRQRVQADKLATINVNSSAKRKTIPINIPLHGPRVDVILAWLGAVHLPELDDA